MTDNSLGRHYQQAHAADALRSALGSVVRDYLAALPADQARDIWEQSRTTEQGNTRGADELGDMFRDRDAARATQQHQPGGTLDATEMFGPGFGNDPIRNILTGTTEIAGGTNA